MIISGSIGLLSYLVYFSCQIWFYCLVFLFLLLPHWTAVCLNNFWCSSIKWISSQLWRWNWSRVGHKILNVRMVIWWIPPWLLWISSLSRSVPIMCLMSLSPLRLVMLLQRTVLVSAANLQSPAAAWARHSPPGAPDSRRQRTSSVSSAKHRRISEM